MLMIIKQISVDFSIHYSKYRFATIEINELRLA